MLDNRQRFMESCQIKNLIIANCLFKNPVGKHCTDRDVGTAGFYAPCSPDTFAEIDFVILENDAEIVQD